MRKRFKFGFTKKEATSPSSGRGVIKRRELTNAVRPIAISNKIYNKIFCVGYNKTGTTTLEAVLRMYGFELPNQQEQEIRLTQRCFATDYTEFFRFVSRYDAFQDLPFSQESTYVVADALFPNSKFILSERDSEAWFSSMVSFHQKAFGVNKEKRLTEQDIIEKFNYLYPGYSHKNKELILSYFVGSERRIAWDKLYDKDLYIRDYERRNEQIKRYFMGAPDKLLIIDVTKQDSTLEICRFLNIPDEFATEMPRFNKT